ncbi:MAG: Signal transduction histidine kinase [Promethearchaeota archaeon]|nr:MAG: Signal transduction histidine kinase [Candidatus Lokiarchaeota archaeon]
MQNLPFESILNNLTHGLLILDPKGQITYLNEKATSILSNGEEKLTGKNFCFLSVFSVQQKNALQCVLNKIPKNKASVKQDLKIHRDQKQKLWIRLEGKKIENRDLLLILIEETTQRKRKQKMIEKFRKNDNLSKEVETFPEDHSALNNNLEFLKTKYFLNENGYRELFEKSPNAIVLTTSKGKVIDLNPVAERMCGYSKSDIIGKNYANLNIYEKKHKKIFLERFKQFKKGKNPGQMELKVTNRYGKTYWLNYQSSFIPLNGDYIVEAIIQDITQKKQTEFALKKSETRYRKIIENSKEGYFEVDLKGNLTFFNDALLKLSGYERDELMGMHYKDYMDRENIKRTYEAFNEVYRTGEEKTNYQYELISKNGDKVYGETTIGLRYEKGKKIGFCGFLRDITDQKVAERRLKESEEKFRKIAEQSILSIIILQEDRVRYINKPFADLVGYSKEEIKDWEPSEYKKLIHPEDRHSIVEQAKKKQDGEPNIKSHYRFRMIRKTGEIIWVENYSKTITYEGKSANFITLADITEKKKAEEIIKEENKKLKKLDEMRREFVNRASHELKTPLTSVHGAIQLLDKFYKKEFSEKSEDLLELAYRGTKRLKSLIYSLLDVSRLEADKFNLEKEEADLVKIINDCIEDLEYLIEDRKMNIEFDYEDKIYLMIDKIRIEQVIINLISNAVKNTPINGYIKIKVEKEDTAVQLSVKDNGIGLTEEEMKVLFKKFNKIERYDKNMEISSEGTGLGLYISKEIVESHGGKIWARSEGRYKGSVFFVKLPLQEL